MTDYTKKCSACNGTGQEYCAKQGTKMKAERLAAGVSQGAVAKALKFKQGYISQLESGIRRWTSDLVKAYRKALKTKPTK